VYTNFAFVDAQMRRIAVHIVPAGISLQLASGSRPCQRMLQAPLQDLGFFIKSI
jgi:hypothetical protein